jgi:vacuolar-type H+-ATPase subunit I/STV1
MSAPVRLARRIAITAAGAILIGLGLVLLIAPGPGFLVIALGLLVLGVEYEWARRRFEQVRDKAVDLADQAAANRLSVSFSMLFGLGMLALGVALIVTESLPASGWATGISTIIAGLAILATIIYSLVTARQRQTLAD